MFWSFFRTVFVVSLETPRRGDRSQKLDEALNVLSGVGYTSYTERLVTFTATITRTLGNLIFKICHPILIKFDGSSEFELL